MELFQCRLAAKGVNLLAHGVGHMAEPSFENVENRLAGFLEDAFLEAFLETFLETFLEAFLETFLDTFLKPLLEGEFFEEGDVGHSFVG